MATKQAPGNLEKVRAFVNTLNIEEGTDLFSTPEGMAAWFVEAGFLQPGSRATRAQLEAAVGVREAIRRVLLANNGDAAGGRETLDTLNRAAETARFSLVFGGGHVVGFEPHAAGVPGAIGRLLAIVAASIADGSWSRMKACASDGCHWAFYDSARNRSGRWCEMAICGNREKARTYRARQA